MNLAVGAGEAPGVEAVAAVVATVRAPGDERQQDAFEKAAAV